jgi:hypothetical protein
MAERAERDASPPPPLPDPRCICREPVKARVYLGTWTCRLCGLLITQIGG